MPEIRAWNEGRSDSLRGRASPVDAKDRDRTLPHQQPCPQTYLTRSARVVTAASVLEGSFLSDWRKLGCHAHWWRRRNACWSRLFALALGEEGLHLLVLQDLHGRL